MTNADACKDPTQQPEIARQYLRGYFGVSLPAGPVSEYRRDDLAIWVTSEFARVLDPGPGLDAFKGFIIWFQRPRETCITFGSRDMDSHTQNAFEHLCSLFGQTPEIL